MKIMSIVGARPNFMKVAPIITAIREYNSSQPATETIDHILVHTGQHYDRAMSDSFFADLDLPEPDVHLGVGSGSHAGQTAEVMKKFEEVALREQPDALIVVGDVNSTLACALVAAKLSFNNSGNRPLIAHVEAGLRSFDKTMPEEVNRIVADHLSDLLFVTEESGIRNLEREGIDAAKVHFVGNTMIDSLLAFREKADASRILNELDLCGEATDSPRSVRPYALLTLHRPANVDNRDAFLNILEGLEELAKEKPVIFPAHPRTQKRIEEFGLGHYFTWTPSLKGIRTTGPLGYLDFLCLMKNASIVVTDSGGIQEETTCLGVPCVTARENTERPVTISAGTNVLAGVSKEGIRAAIRRQLQFRQTAPPPDLWDGKSAARIVDVIRAESRAQSSRQNIASTIAG